MQIIYGGKIHGFPLSHQIYIYIYILCSFPSCNVDTEVSDKISKKTATESSVEQKYFNQEQEEGLPANLDETENNNDFAIAQAGNRIDDFLEALYLNANNRAIFLLGFPDHYKYLDKNNQFVPQTVKLFQQGQMSDFWNDVNIDKSSVVYQLDENILENCAETPMQQGFQLGGGSTCKEIAEKIIGLFKGVAKKAANKSAVAGEKAAVAAITKGAKEPKKMSRLMEDLILKDLYSGFPEQVARAERRLHDLTFMTNTQASWGVIIRDPRFASMQEALALAELIKKNPNSKKALDKLSGSVSALVDGTSGKAKAKLDGFLQASKKFQELRNKAAAGDRDVIELLGILKMEAVPNPRGINPRKDALNDFINTGDKLKRRELFSAIAIIFNAEGQGNLVYLRKKGEVEELVAVGRFSEGLAGLARKYGR